MMHAEHRLWDSVKHQKIPIGVVVAILLWWLLAQEWILETFVTEQELAALVIESEKRHEQFRVGIEFAAREVALLRREVETTEAIKAANVLDTNLWLLQRDQQINGTTEESSQRQNELRQRYDHAILYRDCLLKGTNKCQHLKGV